MMDRAIDVPVSLLTSERANPQSMQAYEQAIRSLFSDRGWEYHQYMRLNRGNFTADFGGINQHFLKQVGAMHGFPANASTARLEAHWGQALNEAYHLVNYAAELAIPPGSRLRGQDTELYDRSPRPERMLRTLAYHPRKVFRTESRRQFALALIVGDFEAFTNIASLRDRNEEIGVLFSGELFANQGEQHDYQTYAHFDSSTNECTGFDKTSSKPPDEHTDVKLVKRVARTIEGVGSVHFKPRIKDPKTAGIKAVAESVDSGQALETIKHVPDKFGSRIVVLDGGEAEVALVMIKAIQAMQAHFPGIGVEIKNKVKKNRGQSELMDDLVPMQRVLFHFPDLPKGASYELIVRTLKSEMNGDYMNGIVNPKTRRRTGPGHKHYELGRLSGPVFNLLFPAVLRDVDKDDALAEQSAVIAETLRYASEDPTVHFGNVQPNEYFSPGYSLVTENAEGGRKGNYLIVGMDAQNFRLRRHDKTEFLVSQTRLREHGLIGSERLLSSVRPLMLEAV